MHMPTDIQEILRNISEATPKQLESISAVLRGESSNQELALDKPALLTKGQASKILGISRTTLWRMLKQGKISGVEVVPGMVRIPLAEVQAILQGQRKEDSFHG